jgi:hypothetical protein
MTEQEDPLRWEEEKKESSPKKPVSGGVTPTSFERAHSGLPKEISKKKYASERDLRIDLEKLGADDLQIVLNKQGFPAWREMPGEAHRFVVGEIADLFDEWKNGRLIKGEKEANVFVNDSFSRPRKEKRCPDFAIFGPDRMQGRRIRTVRGKGVNPHVIIQFSWANDIVEEARAVDDIMHHAGVGEYDGLGRPNAAYLIKALHRGNESDSPVYGFNVFQVDRDQETPDEPTMKYRCGGQEDVEISIAPAAIGLVGDEGEPFKIGMRDIRKALEALDIEFVPALENEM